MNPWLASAIVAAVLGGMLAGLGWYRRRFAPHPEVPRKIMHVGMGLVAMALPLVFEHARAVMLLAGGAAVLMLLVRMTAIGRRVGAGVVEVERTTLGEVYFPIAVGLLAWLAWDRPLFYVIPIAILAIGDALAAAAGMRYGRLRYSAEHGFKTVEGSMAMFAVSFLAVHVPLLLLTDVGRAESLLIACIIALLVTLMEAASWRGIDNLLVPLVACLLLVIYESLDVPALLLRLGVVALLVTFVLLWRRRSEMDDSALVASALYGYLALMVGGWPWLLAPLGVFVLRHLLRRVGAGAGMEGTAAARCAPHVHVLHMLAVTSTSLLCLLLLVRGRHDLPLLPAHALSLAVHWVFLCLVRGPCAGASGDAAPVRRWLVIGWLTGLALVLAPTIIVAGPVQGVLFALCGAGAMIAAGAIMAVVARRMSAPGGADSRLALLRAVLAAAATAGVVGAWALAATGPGR